MQTNVLMVSNLMTVLLAWLRKLVYEVLILCLVILVIVITTTGFRLSVIITRT